ncbi:MAG: hypothetical protein EPO08_20825 [Rhodospirillaceae bacterium]|nr:MAG: hypothetical protein EPO08_20825 [Rhodospirillaceae bacterium]
MQIYDIEQGSESWKKIRAGLPTASCFDRILTPTGKPSTQAEAYAHLLIAEILTGNPVNEWEGNAHTERGKELEEEAALAYEMEMGIELRTIGFCTNDARTVGCSPDRLAGDDGLVEIKCPAAHNHVRNMLNGLDMGYYPQIQGQLLVTGRKWCNFLSYYPGMELVIVRVERDKDYLFKLTEALEGFNALLKGKLKTLKDKGYGQ